MARKNLSCVCSFDVFVAFFFFWYILGFFCLRFYELIDEFVSKGHGALEAFGKNFRYRKCVCDLINKKNFAAECLGFVCVVVTMVISKTNFGR